jgi:hypothetical protein
MASGVFTEWLNANASRNYPIVENANRTDTSGNFVIPNSVVLAAQINFPRSYVNGNFFIKEIGYYQDAAYFVVGFVDGVGIVFVLFLLNLGRAMYEGPTKDPAYDAIWKKIRAAEAELAKLKAAYDAADTLPNTQVRALPAPVVAKPVPPSQAQYRAAPAATPKSPQTPKPVETDPFKLGWNIDWSNRLPK